jgi:hypothetical protein
MGGLKTDRPRDEAEGVGATGITETEHPFCFFANG